MNNDNRFYATGRRKTSVARVYLIPGTGKITVNGKTDIDYFTRETLTMIVSQPLKSVTAESKFDVVARLNGGGLSGQAGALRHGIARALIIADQNYRKTLKEAGYLTRDARKRERKKYGHKGARKSFQFSKR